MPEEFDCFLSHNSKDKPAVQALAEALKQRGIKVWLDVDQIAPGDRFQQALERGIQSSKCAAILVGKDGLGPWEVPEMEACLNRATSGSPGRCAPPVFPSPWCRPLAWKTSCPRRASLAWRCNRGRNLRSSVCDMGNGKSESRMANRHTINLTLTVYQPT